MELSSILIIVSAVVVLLVLWFFVGHRHFKFLKSEIRKQWELVDENYRKRQDILPNLIETARVYATGQDGLMEELIKNREAAARETVVGAAKSEKELALKENIGRVVDLGRLFVELSKDTNFLELRKELEDLGMEIEAKMAKYNEMIAAYNSEIGKVFLLPVAVICGHRKM